LTHHKIDFGLDAAWTFSLTAHDKGAGDGIGAFLKLTVRRPILSTSVRISLPKDFYAFLTNHQFETVVAAEKANVLKLEVSKVEKIKNRIINLRIEKFKSIGKSLVIF